MATTALAQTAKEPVEPTKPSASELHREAEMQQRRSSLRASLKSQTELAQRSETQALPERQLSAQQRADLRQQLRRQ